jgi:hypothetical protein
LLRHGILFTARLRSTSFLVSFFGLDGSTDFPARTLETMTSKQDRIRIEFYPSTHRGGAEAGALTAADDVGLALARLIGRQMAREQFERAVRQERKTRKKKRPADGDA